jgi:GNAT superfamily N-acetyltransferase
MLMAVATLRSAAADDAGFLEQMLAVAADWREATPRPVDEVLAIPQLARYIEGWPRPDDFGIVAEEHAPVGAAWWRHFPSESPGYGFVDEETPEISIGVLPEARNAGTGTLLLTNLISAARNRGIPRLSLSVEIENPARRLYQRLGFHDATTVGESVTMLLAL